MEWFLNRFPFGYTCICRVFAYVGDENLYVHIIFTAVIVLVVLIFIFK